MPHLLSRMLRVALDMQTISLEDLHQLNNQIEAAILDWGQAESQVDRVREKMVRDFVVWGRQVDIAASEEQLRAVAAYLYDTGVLQQSPDEVIRQGIGGFDRSDDTV